MFRVLGIGGLGILFVMISPPLRVTLLDDGAAIVNAFQEYSPLSYVGLGVAVLLGMMFALHRASQPRC